MPVDRDFATMQDFIVGRLSDAERRAFEDRLVRDPTLVRELEQSLRMREGLQQLRTQGYLKKNGSSGASFRIWVPTLIAAAGAGLALFLWLPRITGSSPILVPSLALSTNSDMTPLVAAHFTFLSVRGGLAPDLDLPSTGLIEIRAAPSAPRSVHRYRVTLVRQEEGSLGKTVAALGGLPLGMDGYLRCYADASRLSAGSYLLRIQPDTATPGIVELFPFNFRARSTAPVQ